MKKIILCSSNPILIKSLYGILRDEGHLVETIEHPAFAVHLVMQKHYDCVVIDSEPFGLSAHDAVEIIKTIDPGVRILYVGSSREEQPDAVEAPLDLEEFKKTISRISV